MLIMFLVVMGVFSFVDLGVDLFPKSDPATVNVRIRLPGASPEEMVSQVILPLEARPFRDAFVYGAVIACLIWRPQGLFAPKAAKQRV